MSDTCPRLRQGNDVHRPEGRCRTTLNSTVSSSCREAVAGATRTASREFYGCSTSYSGHSSPRPSRSPTTAWCQSACVRPPAASVSTPLHNCRSQLGLTRFLFPSRLHGTRKHARIFGHWVDELGLDRADYGMHPMRRSKATLIYRRTKNLRAVVGGQARLTLPARSDCLDTGGDLHSIPQR